MIRKYLQSVLIPHHKNTANMIPIRMNTPKKVTIPLSMHIGAPAVPIVKIGDLVQTGTKIAEAGGFVSAPVHSSVTGTVSGFGEIVMQNGMKANTIEITSIEHQEYDENIKVPDVHDLDSFISAVKESGAVGLGGAGFPTYVKLKVDPDRVEYFVINGAECEPYITSDTHTMVDNTPRMMAGIRELQKYYPKAKVVIGIEENKRHAIEVFRTYADKIDHCDVITLPSSYPQGAEKSLIYNTLHKIVPEGKLPIDVGCIVLNATTLSFIGKYLTTGIPLITKCVTVDGSAVKEPKNIIAPIGTSMADIVEAAGGLKCEAKKVLYGGPMMGTSVTDLNSPIMKSTNAILLFDEKDAVLPEATECIHCGRCIKACSMNLCPTEMEQARLNKDIDRLKKLHVNLCVECGACTFVCPAKRMLTESHKIAKMLVREADKR